jgi:hypothetical protein
LADEARVDEERFTAFQQSFSGDLQRPTDEGYDEARQLWNGMFDKRPAIVAMCTGAADVIDAVNFARENGLRVAVRGGGHGVAGTGSIDDGMMINLSRMNSVRVDRQAGTVRVGGGATWAAADRQAGVDHADLEPPHRSHGLDVERPARLPHRHHPHAVDHRSDHGPLPLQRGVLPPSPTLLARARDFLNSSTARRSRPARLRRPRALHLHPRV